MIIAVFLTIAVQVLTEAIYGVVAGLDPEIHPFQGDGCVDQVGA